MGHCCKTVLRAVLSPLTMDLALDCPRVCFMEEGMDSKRLGNLPQATEPAEADPIQVCPVLKPVSVSRSGLSVLLLAPHGAASCPRLNG